jgi:hypothetical protein
VKIVGESASADFVAAESFPNELRKLIMDKGYLPEEVFNADETGLFWKRMPSRTYLTKSEKSAPGFKVAKDRLTLLFCVNASGRMIKPKVVYKSLNPRALKGKNNEHLPVYWSANKKAWVTASLFTEWIRNCFLREVELYLASKSLPFKVLLLIDNAPGHPENRSLLRVTERSRSVLSRGKMGVNFEEYKARIGSFIGRGCGIRGWNYAGCDQLGNAIACGRPCRH